MEGRIKKVTLLCLTLACLLSGCGGGLQIDVERDVYLTGGSLSFSYDENSKTAYFGGENEVIGYYEGDISRGIDEGNRVGLKITLGGVDDLGSLTFKVGREEFSGEDVATLINDKPAYFQIFPLVEKSGDKIHITLEYKDKKGDFYVKIHEKCILMEKTPQKS